MSKKSLYAVLVAAGTFAWAPTPASAFHGNLVRCTPTLGNTATVSLKPGLNCTDAKDKIALALVAKKGTGIDNCVGNAGAPWAEWQTGGIQKISAGDATAVNKMDISLKGLTFGSCNFTGDANSYTAYAAGKFQLFNGGTKVKGGGGALFARVAGVAATTSANALGIVTKGYGAGAAIEAQTGLNLAGPTLCCGKKNPGCTDTCNGLILACNTGAICGGGPDPFDPNNDSPITTLDIINIPSSHTSIDLPSNADCTGPAAPITCCTGNTAGSCS